MFSVLPGPVADQCPVAMMPDCSEKVDSLEVVPSALQPESSSETDNYQLLEERVNTLEFQVYYLYSQLALRAHQPAQESQLVPQPQPAPQPQPVPVVEAPIAHPNPMVEVIELPVQ